MSPRSASNPPSPSRVPFSKDEDNPRSARGDANGDELRWKDGGGVGLRRRKFAKSSVGVGGAGPSEQLCWEGKELVCDGTHRDLDVSDASDDEPPSVGEISSCTNSSTEPRQPDDVDADSVPYDVATDQEASASTAASDHTSFLAFRLQYLIVHVAIMLADGMQGTHLYVLYEGYGYSVATLYCLGFVSGAVTSPFIGPIVDKIGRKKAAIIYCVLEIGINLLEQYDILIGLVISRVVGGITTNLLFSVFEAWLVTEHRRRGFCEVKLETIMRDSVVASNLSAIASGYFAHALAARFGPVGPFEGAVGCTFVALVLVCTKWEENYGSTTEVKSVQTYMREAFITITSDPKILRIGVIQGLSDDASRTWGLDTDGEPAYGLIFGAFMACGVLGGLLEPTVRGLVSPFLSCFGTKQTGRAKEECKQDQKPVGVEFLAASTYIISAGLLATPLLVNQESPHGFTVSLAAFLVYEFMIGLYMPCEGVIRTIYMPNDSICSLMTMLRIIINVLVAVGVFSTNFISFTSAFAAGSISLTIASLLQFSLVDKQEWSNLTSNMSSLFLMRPKSIDLGQGIDIVKSPLPPPLEIADSPMSSCTTCTSDESIGELDSRFVKRQVAPAR